MKYLILLLLFLTGKAISSDASTFYKQSINLESLTIQSSNLVPKQALIEARKILDRMLTKNRLSLLNALSKKNVKVVVMAVSEKTTDIPEHSDLKPKSYWDKRARGLGATHSRPITSCAEENILKYANDPYKGENILIHEFAHTILDMGIIDLDKTFKNRLIDAYNRSLDNGLWKDTYAAKNYKEYWAEGVQSWFNANMHVNKTNGIHNHVNLRSELQSYDPALALLISEWFD